jgi:hypothetical protein
VQQATRSSCVIAAIRGKGIITPIGAKPNQLSRGALTGQAENAQLKVNLDPMDRMGFAGKSFKAMTRPNIARSHMVLPWSSFSRLAFQSIFAT